jgi:hypothetical protein
MNSHPRVFVSHASEDKAFVIPFATRLRNSGIDAWVDQWELLPGDSLVEKLFEEGIKNADSLLIFLSRNSVNKPWVREELNLGIVQRLTKKMRIIPILLDDCGVPASLASTFWVRVQGDSSDAAFDEVLRGILQTRKRPALGQLPEHSTSDALAAISDLEAIDSLVLATACEIALEQGDDFINVSQITGKLVSSKGVITEDALRESCEILADRGYIDCHDQNKAYIDHFVISVFGMQLYAESNLTNYSTLIDVVASKVVNEGISFNKDLAAQLGIPVMLANHILELFESQGLVQLSKALGNTCHVSSFSAELKRRLRNGAIRD